MVNDISNGDANNAYELVCPKSVAGALTVPEPDPDVAAAQRA